MCRLAVAILFALAAVASAEVALTGAAADGAAAGEDDEGGADPACAKRIAMLEAQVASLTKQVDVSEKQLAEQRVQTDGRITVIVNRIVEVMSSTPEELLEMVHQGYLWSRNSKPNSSLEYAKVGTPDHPVHHSLTRQFNTSRVTTTERHAG